MKTTTIKMQARGVLTLPKKMRTHMKLDTGSLVDVREKDGSILISPTSRLDPDLQEALAGALNDLKSGNYIEFSSVREFHKKRKAKWGRK